MCVCTLNKRLAHNDAVASSNYQLISIRTKSNVVNPGWGIEQYIRALLIDWQVSTLEQLQCTHIYQLVPLNYHETLCAVPKRQSWSLFVFNRYFPDLLHVHFLASVSSGSWSEKQRADAVGDRSSATSLSPRVKFIHRLLWQQSRV